MGIACCEPAWIETVAYMIMLAPTTWAALLQFSLWHGARPTKTCLLSFSVLRSLSR